MSETGPKKLLLIKTGSLRARAQRLVDTFGDQEDIFRAAAGYGAATSEVVEVWTGAAIPHPPSRYRGILITGSGAMVSDRAPWMERTARWLRDAVAAEVPILGICFGHSFSPMRWAEKSGAIPLASKSARSASRSTTPPPPTRCSRAFPPPRISARITIRAS